MCKKQCQYWTASLPSVKDFDWLKENYIPQGSVPKIDHIIWSILYALYYMTYGREQMKDFFLTAERGFSKGGKLKDICKHGKCQNRYNTFSRGFITYES